MELGTKIKFQKVFPEDDLSTVLKKLELSKHKVIFCLDKDGYIVGTITDGDVRRALISDKAGSLNAKTIANQEPLVANKDNLSSILEEAKKKNISVVPVTKNNKLMYCVKTDEISKKMLSTVVIMAGGLGTRLGDLTKDKPKPLVKIKDTPIIKIAINNLINQGFKDFKICINYKGHMIKDYLLENLPEEINLEFIDEKKRMGTAGALFYLKDKLKNDFLLINADVITNLNFSDLLRFHSKRNNFLTVCVNKQMVSIPYGVIEHDNMQIREIKEKPSFNYLYNAGIYVLSPSCLQKVPEDFFDMTDLINENIDKENIGIFPLFEYWKDIGMPLDLKEAIDDYKNVFK